MSTVAATFTARALSGIQSLPPAQRIDLYEFASSVLRLGGLNVEADAAAKAAANIAEAETAQLHFQALLAISNTAGRPEAPKP